LSYVTNFSFFIHTDEAKAPLLTSELLLCSIHPSKHPNTTPSGSLLEVV
jgi:hypothetical protein